VERVAERRRAERASLEVMVVLLSSFFVPGDLHDPRLRDGE
jgi:hypothetical protein